jgi:hypothetical protein
LPLVLSAPLRHRTIPSGRTKTLHLQKANWVNLDKPLKQEDAVSVPAHQLWSVVTVIAVDGVALVNLNENKEITTSAGLVVDHRARRLTHRK